MTKKLITPRRSYTRPELRSYGLVRNLTQGGSGPTTEVQMSGMMGSMGGVMRKPS